MTKKTFFGGVVPVLVFAGLATYGYMETSTHLLGIGAALGFMLCMGQDFLINKFSDS